MARLPFRPNLSFPVTEAAPHLRGFWNTDRIIWAQIAALLPPLGLAAFSSGLSLAGIIGVALVTAAAWQGAFARWRRLPFCASGAVTALIVAVMVPGTASLWQIALAITFAVVIGEQIFGGYGRNFVNTAALALAFLMFSFPDGGYDKGGITDWAVVAPGGLALMALGFVNWRIVAAALIGAGAVLLAKGGMPATEQVLAGSFAFAVVFLASDPVSAPSTNGGRWIYGAAVGAMAALGAANGSFSARAVVFACLIGSIFAPLVDQGAIWINHRLRKWRHGRA
jgi:Na+-transporting NADH:ubiquinone oxidoreductase subunit B